jgi:hypothetical protein
MEFPIIYNFPQGVSGCLRGICVVSINTILDSSVMVLSLRLPYVFSLHRFFSVVCDGFALVFSVISIFTTRKRKEGFQVNLFISMFP